MKNLEELRREIDRADEQIAAAFCRRMQAVCEIADYKKERGLPVYDAAREEEILHRAEERVADDELRGYYRSLQKDLMGLSRAYQQSFFLETSGVLPVRLGERSYNVIVVRGALDHVGEWLNLDRKVLIVTDSGVPERYAETVAKACRAAKIVTVPSGEESKSFPCLQTVLRAMMEFEMTRGDCVVAVGGGVPGDLGGFAASIYMRGIDFYNVPTTLLSQVDSSIGGKTAVNFGGVKNAVGSFYQPKRVVIDPNVLKTLDTRQFRSGLAEIVKMAATSNAALFERLEREPVEAWTDEMIVAALQIKRAIVEADEREAGERKLLNFGHTVGHAIEAIVSPARLHGECVAVGMLPMCGAECRGRLRDLLQKIGLPTDCPVAVDEIMKGILHDKKRTEKGIDCVLVEKIGQGKIVSISPSELETRIRSAFGGNAL